LQKAFEERTLPVPSILGSLNTGFAKQITGAADVIFLNRKAGRLGDKVSPHGKGHHKHPINPIIKGCNTLLVNNRPAAYLGVFDLCQHKMIPIKSTLIIGS
jgi:uncharacterized Zn-binding protein involved in type VI secretion